MTLAGRVLSYVYPLPLIWVPVTYGIHLLFLSPHPSSSSRWIVGDPVRSCSEIRILGSLIYDFPPEVEIRGVSLLTISPLVPSSNLKSERALRSLVFPMPSPSHLFLCVIH